MKLSKLLSMIMSYIDIVEYYDEHMNFLYSFPMSEIPEDCEDKILKFNIYEKEDKRILEVIEK